jgi:hypothetical protein
VITARSRFMDDAADLRRLADWLEKSAPDGPVDDLDRVTPREIALAYFRLSERLEKDARRAREFASIYAGPLP